MVLEDVPAMYPRLFPYFLDRAPSFRSVRVGRRAIEDETGDFYGVVVVLKLEFSDRTRQQWKADGRSDSVRTAQV